MAVGCGVLGQPFDSPADPGTAAGQWQIVPGERVGPVGGDSSLEALRRAVGNEQLADSEVYLAEGFCTPGSLLYPGSANEVEIAWADEQRTQVAFVRVRQPGSQWRTRAGVGIGTTLKELEAIAGEALSFNGFGWDYGGGLHWQEDGRALGLQLGTDWSAVPPEPRSDEIYGDRVVASDHPVVRQMDIVVEAISLSWASPFVERECG